MTAAVLNAFKLPTINVYSFFRPFLIGVHNAFAASAKARAAAELHRMGRVDAAKALMLDDSMYLK